jgi:hypothetical protein
MRHLLRLLFIYLLPVGTVMAQAGQEVVLDSGKTKSPIQAKIGLFGSAGMYRGFRQPEGICFDCTPRNYETPVQHNALATFGIVTDFGKPKRHFGIRGALGLAYQQIKWDYEVEFWPRGYPLQQATVHLRANRLLLDLNLKLRYSTFGKHPLSLQAGFFANGFLTRGTKSYSTTPNRSAFYNQLLVPPMGGVTSISLSIVTKAMVIEPFAELRYSFVRVIWDPDVTSGSLQLGLIAWLP